MSTPRPFTAATSKLAYAQAFAAPASPRPARRPGLLRRVTAHRGAAKRSVI